jgi:hypothetical protein
MRRAARRSSAAATAILSDPRPEGAVDTWPLRDTMKKLVLFAKTEVRRIEW